MDTLENYMEKFFDDYSLKFQLCTLKCIQSNVKALVAFSGKNIHDIQSKDIRNWLLHLQEKGYAQVTVNTKFFRVKRFFQYCFEENIITQDLFRLIPNPNQVQTLPRYLTMEQITLLRELVVGNVLQSAVIEVFYSTGVRISELCSIMLEDINWSEKSILIRRGKGKRDRMVLFTKKCEGNLHNYLQSRTDKLPFLFLNHRENGRISRYTISDWFLGYSQKLGIRVTAHLLRHTFAAHLAIKGMSFEYIQALMGHEEPKTTKIYTRLYNYARKDMYDQLM